MLSLHEQIEANLARQGRIGVAVSGGADSVFLLYALHELGTAVAILHVNHKLRGEESELDEQFVRHLGSHLGLPVWVRFAKVESGNVEQEARQARYAFFEEQIAAGLCDSVATGHTKDDQAETVLGRFLRGSGTAGLSGIRPVTATGIVRPLLHLGRDEIRASLRQRGIDWREDRSNLDTAFLRNRLRLDIMPRLAVLNPSLPDVLASFADWAQGEEDFWDGEMKRLEAEILIPNRDAVLARTGDLRRLPVAAERRLIRRMIDRVRGSLRSIDFRHVEAVRGLVASTEGSGRLQLPDVDIYRSFDWLRIAPVGFDTRLERDFELPLSVPGVTEVPERGIRLAIETAAPRTGKGGEGVYNDEVNALDRDALDREKPAGALLLRNWRPGDRLQPPGRTSAEKIKTLFQESRIPLWERRNWPVIVSGGSVVWARRFGASREFAAGPDSERILLVRETGESNVTVGTSIATGA